VRFRQARFGVCIATSGPGATNLVTPIADACMDSTPMITITGQLSSLALGRDAFQETDITGITVPITKHNYLVQSVEEIPYVIKEAFHLARSGRPAPVLLDVTKDAQQTRTIPRWDRPLRLPRHKSAGLLDRGAVERATALLVGAARPLVMAGTGVIQSGGAAELSGPDIMLTAGAYGVRDARCRAGGYRTGGQTVEQTRGGIAGG
jgi:acetolactate synthase-1/2/3 large subunit